MDPCGSLWMAHPAGVVVGAYSSSTVSCGMWKRCIAAIAAARSGRSLARDSSKLTKLDHTSKAGLTLGSYSLSSRGTPSEASYREPGWLEAR